MNKNWFGVVVLSLMGSVMVAQSNTLSLADCNSLTGSWRGTLTYLDYSSGKPYTMPAALKISDVNQSDRQFWSMAYPDEPQANELDTVLFDLSNQIYDGEKVLEVKRGEDQLVWITQIMGKDGNDQQSALIQHEYKRSGRELTITKRVRFVTSDKWLVRHTYQFTREGQ